MAGGAKRTPGPLMNEVAGILRAKIGRENYTHAAIAAAVGLSQSQISGIVNAKKQVDVEQLDAICWAVGLKLVDVVDEADKASLGRYMEDSWSVTALRKS